MPKNKAPQDFISLIGMPGSGKSTLGRRLAQQLGWQFVDMDQYIQQMAGCSIGALFAQGEGVFRDWEMAACGRLSGNSHKDRQSHVLSQGLATQGLVLACGGGVVMRAENVQRLRQRGLVVFLDTPLAQIASQVDLTNRPLLQSGREALEILYQQRYALYCGSAHLQVVNQGAVEAGLSALLTQITAEQER